MVNTELENTVTSKSILKRRIRNVERAAAAKEPNAAAKEPNGTAAAAVAERDGAANACGKRFVTFDETITVKNDKDLVVKKPLKLELVIDNWKSSGAGGSTKTADELTRPDPGLVRRLVDEFNTVQDKAAKLTNDKSSLLGRMQKRGRVNDLINMYNSKSASSNKPRVADTKFIDF